MGSFAAGGRQIVVRMGNVEKALSKPAVTRRLTAAGNAAKRAAEPVPAQDLGGDNAFSGWRRKDPIPLKVKFTVKRDGLGLVMHRDRRSAGQWRVAESGRNQGGHSGFAGPAVNRRTGETNRTKTGRIRKPRFAGGRRWNGRTAGMGTWSKTRVVLAKKSTETFEKSTKADVAAAFKGRA